MKGGQQIGVIIPALNEEEAIEKVLNDIPNWVDVILVVDNGSIDRTANIARIHGAHVISEKKRGYGAACLAGTAYLANFVDIFVFLDGDYSDHPDEMARIVDPVLLEHCELVIGSRTRGAHDRDALTPQQRLGNWLACKLMLHFWGVRYTDLGPFRAITRIAFKKLKMVDKGYGWTVEMQIKAALKRLAIKEVPVSYRKRIGSSKISGTVTGTILAGVTILTIIAKFAIREGITSFLTRK